MKGPVKLELTQCEFSDIGEYEADENATYIRLDALVEIIDRSLDILTFMSKTVFAEVPIGRSENLAKIELLKRIKSEIESI